MYEQARHSLTPNQVRHPTDCRFTSGCSPPRLAATQLTSITEPATGSGTDLHRAVKASSRTHSYRRRPVPMAIGGHRLRAETGHSRSRMGQVAVLSTMSAAFSPIMIDGALVPMPASA